MTTKPAITSIEGTWYIDGLPEGERGLLVIRSNGRAVQFPTSNQKPAFSETMRLWHSSFDGSSVQFKLTPDGREWSRGVEATLSGWDLIAEFEGTIYRYPCEPAAPESLPEWYSSLLEENLRQMEALEKETGNLKD